MKNHYSSILTLACLAYTLSATAETIIIEARVPGGGVTPNPPYQEIQGNWANSGSHTTAAGTTQVTPTIGSRFASSPTTPPILRLNPTLQPNTTYRLSIAHILANSSPNLVVGITYEGCTGTATSTTAFNSAPANVWEEVTDITMGDGSIPPAIIFTYQSGTLAGTGGRWYSDAFKFQNDTCIFSTVRELSTVNGPLAEGQNYIDVPGITNTATAVTVYANGVQIGQKTSDVTAGVNRITTSPLVKGQMITATQSDPNGIECCRPVSGQFVGSGPNPPINIAVTIRQTNLTDSAIGVNGGAPGSFLKFIGATNVAGTLLAPLGAKLFHPSNGWQTVTFQRGDDPANPIDPTYNWNVADPTFNNQLAYNFGVFDAIVFTAPHDTGPFAIYIDEFRNGDTLVQGFEGAALGQNGSTFTQPSFSGTTSGFLLSQAPGTINPNIAMVTNNASDGGAHSLYVTWQFNTTNIPSCLRLPAVATSTGSTPNPIVDLRLPISFRMLILPVGQTPPPLPAEAITGPANVRVIRGGSATMRFTYRGTAPFTFQWRHNGVDIPGETGSTLSLSDVQVADAGSYTVVVSNALGSDESPAGTLTVDDVPYTDIMTSAWTLETGSRPYLANDNNTRSIAWSPSTGNLLLASRSAGTNLVYVLDGNTGALLNTLMPPAGGFTFGTLPLNQVAVASNGNVYVGNLTTDGAATSFRLYRWFDEFGGEEPIIVWEGNPDPNSHLRWGDSMIVRGEGGAHEVIISCGGSNLLALLQPDFGLQTPAVIAEMVGAPANSFRLGLAAAGSDIWGKVNGQPLRQGQVDFSLGTGSILNSFSGLNSMAPIGVNPEGTLLAGVFIDNPDHLRLFDISTPGTITALDTELFPSDNANGNATGSVAFGNNKVYALDSNNGLIAMNLDVTCLPDRLTIERSGTDVILRWNRASFSLQGTDTLGGTWTPVVGASPVTVNAATGLQFFRLVCPAIP